MSLAIERRSRPAGCGRNCGTAAPTFPKASSVRPQCPTSSGLRHTVRPEPKIAVFLDLFDRAEQEELTYRTLATGTVEALRNAFRRGLSRG